MSDLYTSLAQTFGPFVQVSYALLMLFLLSCCISVPMFWGERKLIQKTRYLWVLPFLIFSVGLLYGCLRFSGLLVYPTDGWDPWGSWNYTNQNVGAAVIFCCVCLLVGAGRAVYKENFSAIRKAMQ